MTIIRITNLIPERFEMLIKFPINKVTKEVALGFEYFDDLKQDHIDNAFNRLGVHEYLRDEQHEKDGSIGLPDFNSSKNRIKRGDWIIRYSNGTDFWVFSPEEFEIAFRLVR